MKAILEQHSGVQALCGEDTLGEAFRAYAAKKATTSPTSIEGIKVLVNRVRKAIGAFYWMLGGKVACITFSGQYAIQIPLLRDMVLAGSDHFGISMDPAKNSKVTSVPPYYEGDPVSLHRFQSLARIFVVPPAEEYYVAERVANLTCSAADAAKVLKTGSQRHQAKYNI